MKFITAFAMACAMFVTQAMASPGPGNGHGKGQGGGAKSSSTPVGSPNRIHSSQLRAGPQDVQLSGRSPEGIVLVDAHGRVVGRPAPLRGSVTSLATRFWDGRRELSLLIDGAAGEAECDGARCKYGPGLAWFANGGWLLVYASPDCSGDPKVAHHGTAAGFDAVAFPVREDNGLYMYVARNQPQDVLVGSWRNSGEAQCNREQQAYTESALPLEGAYPTTRFGVAPMRWR